MSFRTFAWIFVPSTYQKNPLSLFKGKNLTRLKITSGNETKLKRLFTCLSKGCCSRNTCSSLTHVHGYEVCLYSGDSHRLLIAMPLMKGITMPMCAVLLLQKYAPALVGSNVCTTCLNRRCGSHSYHDVAEVSARGCWNTPKVLINIPSTCRTDIQRKSTSDR